MGCSASQDDRAKMRWNGFNESLSTLDRKTSSRRKLSAEIRAMYTTFSPEVITILHFNDVYNIEPGDVEPVGGAARFATAIKELQHVNPLLLFSGDCLNPSMMSNVTRGRQMLPILNALKVHAAVYGNHEFDFGVDELNDFVMETNFPWLMSNVLDNLTEEPLADGLVRHIIEWSGKKLGIIGLVEEEWLVTLATIDREDLTYLDYVTHGRRLARELKQQGADYVIALTHMRWPNDIRLAQCVDEIDLILGGHDHDYEVKRVNGKPIVKSGSDFRTMTRVTIEFALNAISVCTEKVNVTSDIEEDADMKEIVDAYQEIVAKEMEGNLGYIEVDLDGRFSSIRTGETNLGNFVTDIMLEATQADVALLNSGTFRSDRIHSEGEFKKRDLMHILPLVDSLVVLEVTGKDLLEALENGVSQYPKHEGRFPQVSAVRFGFDPDAEPGERIDPFTVIIEGEHLLPNKKYRLCTKAYVAQGKDGYTAFKNCKRLVSDEEGPILSTIVQNHFNSIQMVKGLKPCKSGHRQSLIGLARKASLTQTASIRHIESQASKLAPIVEGRIFQLDEEERVHLAARKKVFYEAVEHGDIVLQKEHGKERLAAHLQVPTVSVTEASLSGDDEETVDWDKEVASMLGIKDPVVNSRTKPVDAKDFEHANERQEQEHVCQTTDVKQNGEIRKDESNNNNNEKSDGEVELSDDDLRGSYSEGEITLSTSDHHLRGSREDSGEDVESFSDSSDDGGVSGRGKPRTKKCDDVEIFSIGNTYSLDNEDDSVFIHDNESEFEVADAGYTCNGVQRAKHCQDLSHKNVINGRLDGTSSEETVKLSITEIDLNVPELLASVRSDNLQQFQRLQDKNGFDMYRFYSNKTVLHVAAECNATCVARYLLIDCNMNPEITDKTTKVTPLMIASQHGHVSVAQLLLEHGASVSSQDSHGVTALQQAITNSQEDMKELLLLHDSGDLSQMDRH